MTPRPHQIEWANNAFDILKQNGLVYNTSLERTGKSLSAVLLVEKVKQTKCLIITKKAAIPDWLALIKAYPIPGKVFEVVNYESVHKATMTPDIAIIDEAHHALSKYPKPSKTFLAVAKVVYGLPLIYLSATPHAETFAQLYHQLRLSPWSPFADYKNFYAWHEEFGIPKTQYLAGRSIKMYNETQEDKIKPIFDRISLGVTRKEIGFKHEANDVAHYVDLEDETLERIRAVMKDRVLIEDEDEILAETVGSALQKAYQIEGGTLKIQMDVNDKGKPIYKSINLGTTEKIDYIKRTWGDTDDMVIMYNYVQEELLLKEHFNHALVLQGDRFAEGISLKHKQHLIIYSMSWRTSKFIQRRNRQADMTREEEIHVHYLLCKDQISENVYDSVVLKNQNFNGRVYREGI
ncbi:MAG: hypothetical protein JHC33_08805 [Ignisphaera sp.]|nr:hypothetical protein [Ignisphaera sp.]